MMKFPYGRRDFNELISEDYLYIDRTHHIRFVEDWGKELLFMRPRRFGKSLWLSTLINYYDVANENDFERLFGHLAIGQAPTPLRNTYMVMRWDFSMIETSGEIQDIQQSLKDHLNDRCKQFQHKYEMLLKKPIDIAPNNAFSTFSSLVSAVKLSGYKLYLFIDEYDNFANEVLMVPKSKTNLETEAQRQRYITLVKGEGLFKTLFKNLKGSGSGDGLDRVFMTGVSPIVLSDVTSGANTFKNISWRKELNDLCGFTDADLRGLARQLLESHDMQDEIEDTKAELEKMMALMGNYYNGSLFIEDFRKGKAKNIPKVYNPTLVFYFLEDFQAEGDYPKQLLDDNLMPDDHKLAHIAGYEDGVALLDDAFARDKQVTVRTLRKRFGVKDLLNADLQRDHLAVLLCHLGALTCVGETKSGHNILEIPNLVIRQLYSERVLTQNVESDDSLVRAGMATADTLFETGNITPLCAFAQDHLLRLYKGRENKDFNELTLKTIFMMLLYHTDMYLVYSEPQIERRYGDLLMLLRPGMRHTELYDILIEFKRMPLSDVTEDVLTQKGETTKKSLNEEAVRTRPSDALKQLTNVKAKFDEATKQLLSYQQKLIRERREDLNLRCYAVVSLGFDRILWGEV
ncbi:MAG: AAA family ATPase [Chloroflexota bacterium]